jgi:hypothetical protein
MLLTTATVLLQLLATVNPRDDRTLRDARSAQMRFESVRRMHLPRDWSRGSSGSCQTRIGRYCYWYDSTESPAAPEPREIADARAKLLAVLDSAAARSPGDGWVAGQRTRYLIEAGRPDDAASAARAGQCRAERWWCAALEGLSLHVAERYAAADSVYAIALRAMPPAQQCEWLDLRLLVSDRLRHELDRASCDERAKLVDRVWTLSQPLWSTPGNDLRTEHFARLTMAAILSRSANAHGMAWGDDSRELLLRYGWSDWYTRYESGTGIYDSPTITGHDREPSYFFFPDAESIDAARRVAPGAWHFRDPLARTRYAPRHLKGLRDLTHVLARFPRGDSMLVAVAYRTRDTALARDSIKAYVATYRGGELRITEPRESALTLMIPNDTMVASIEVRGSASKHAERARYTVDPLARSNGWSVSDLLLFDPAKCDSASVPERILPGAIADMRFGTTSAIGVFWEIESPLTPQPVWMSMTVEPVHVGFARRLATRLRLAPELAPVRLHWQSVVQRPLEGHSVTLRLPPTARGRYRVILTIDRPDGPSLSASREIVVDR